MLADGRTQNFRAWTYFVGSNFTGVMCLLPYLIFRKSNQDFYGTKDSVLQMFDQRSTGLVLLASALLLVIYAVIAGDWNDYVHQFQTRTFVHLISLDFCLMGLILPITSLFADDIARRKIQNTRVLSSLAFIPLFGPLLYLCLRPPLPETTLRST